MNVRTFDFLTEFVAPGDKVEAVAFCTSWKAPVLNPKMVTIAPGIQFTIVAGPDFDVVTGSVSMTATNDGPDPARFAAILDIDTDEPAPEDKAEREAYLVSTWPKLGE